MTYEGRLRENVWVKGSWWDTIIYAILRARVAGVSQSQTAGHVAPARSLMQPNTRSAPLRGSIVPSGKTVRCVVVPVECRSDRRDNSLAKPRLSPARGQASAKALPAPRPGKARSLCSPAVTRQRWRPPPRSCDRPGAALRGLTDVTDAGAGRGPVRPDPRAYWPGRPGRKQRGRLRRRP